MEQNQLNCLQEYNSIIHNRKNNPLPESIYGEVHHIIPKCKSCGGSNESWNLIKLLPEEHYRCHELLVQIYNSGPQHYAMVCAWLYMSTSGKYTVTAQQYGEAKRRMSELNKGKHLSVETKRKISERQKGRPKGPKSEEHKQKLSKSLKGRQYSIETLKRMSDAHKGRIDSRVGHYHSEESKKIMSDKRKQWHKTHPGGCKRHCQMIWIKNERLQRSKLIKKDDPIPEGWVRGKYKPVISTIWINNGIEQRIISKEVDIPCGWTRGMLKRRNI